MDYKEVTLEDIERMENELRHYYSMRKMFLGIGWGLIGLSIILFFLAVFIGAFIAPSNQKIIYIQLEGSRGFLLTSICIRLYK